MDVKWESGEFEVVGEGLNGLAEQWNRWYGKGVLHCGRLRVGGGGGGEEGRAGNRQAEVEV